MSHEDEDEIAEDEDEIAEDEDEIAGAAGPLACQVLDGLPAR